MTELDLKNLSRLPTPTPDVRARKRALADALIAFDEETRQENLETANDKQLKNDLVPTSKGNTPVIRLSNASFEIERRPPMRLSKYSAIAACIVAFGVAIPVAIYFLGQGKINYFAGGSSTERDVSSVSEELASVAPSPKPSSTAKRNLADSNSQAKKPAGPAEQKVAVVPPVGKTQLINPPANERLRELGQFYDYSSQGLTNPTDGLGAVGGSGGGGGIISMEGGVPRTRKNDTYSVGLGSTLRSNFQPNPSAGELYAGHAREFRDKFESYSSNPIKQVATDPVSTFSIDVDTASYSFVRRALNAGKLPPKDSVRVEELINYFTYDYTAPEKPEIPFRVEVNVIPPPWNKVNKLLHVSVKGYDLKATERPRANLVFLVDVSGSMSSQDKLPLVKSALRMLIEELEPEDTIGIVTYASGSGVALEPTAVKDKNKIIAVIDSLGAGGSTAGARGIRDAYRLAEANYDPESVNRIILATDGDFNVGVTNQDELKGYIERKRKSGIYLSILGFGQGNYNDALMQALAQNGNGVAAYIDTLNEARKVLVEESNSALFTIAKDVKIQIEFNPKRVRSYRLIGYDTRMLKREDFNNDRVDAGDVGSGHSVTAIYEVTPVDAPALVDDLRYAPATPVGSQRADTYGEYGFLKLRYKLPNEKASKLLTTAIAAGDDHPTLETADIDTRFSVAVAAFGQLLRGESQVGDMSYDQIIQLATGAKGSDPFGYRAEFINLVRLAKSARP